MALFSVRTTIFVLRTVPVTYKNAWGYSLSVRTLCWSDIYLTIGLCAYVYRQVHLEIWLLDLPRIPIRSTESFIRYRPLHYL